MVYCDAGVGVVADGAAGGIERRGELGEPGLGDIGHVGTRLGSRDIGAVGLLGGGRNGAGLGRHR